MTRTITLSRPAPVEWVPDLPLCARCHVQRWREWYTLLDEGWTCEVCLTGEERARVCRVEETPKGKVDVPREEKGGAG